MLKKIATRHDCSVVLVSLPWTCLNEPSLGLGILRAVLDEAGIPCRVLNLNLFMLEHLRADSYFALANIFALNDFLFSGVLDPKISRKQQRWLRLKTEELLSFNLIDAHQYGGIDGVIEQLLKLRHTIIPQWLANWADQIASSNATLVALTCMFDQTIASLALAHMLKQRDPSKLISLGGYAVRSPTGEAILRSFSCVDAICIGEGEPVIAKLARASAGEISLADVPSLIFRGTDQAIHATEVAPFVDMDSVPIPNYDDFFNDINALSKIHKVEVDATRLPLDNSRGCWWGQKKHCVFCGIHDSDLVYRFRKSERVLEVMASLEKRYGINSFRFSDYILPYQYFETLLPKLVSMGSPYHITSEIKANINAERFALLADAGIEEVQPGIESFSSDVLRKMDKGVSAVQNVYTLLLGKHLNVTVHYNLLHGFPSDDLAQMESMVNLLPRLIHLDPPATRLQVQITRFAPLQTTPERFGINSATYEPSYNLIFSQEFLEERNFNLNDFCYYFERPFENSPRLRRLYNAINRLVDLWKIEHKRRDVSLFYEEYSDEIKIFDFRSEKAKIFCLNPSETFIYRLIAKPITITTLQKHCFRSIHLESFAKALESLDNLGLIFENDNSIIGLALPKPPSYNQNPLNS